MATKIFLNNEWQDYNEESLYNNLGITRTKSKNIVAYDSSMNEISGWNNSGYNWIIRDNQWYSENTTPYYVFTGEKTLLYLIDEKKNLKNFVNRGNIYLQVEGSFFTSEYLHDHLGYTQTPSVVWDVDLGIPWSWYNPEEELYWDNREGKKLWTEEPPSQGGGGSGGSDNYIILVSQGSPLVKCIESNVSVFNFYFTPYGRNETQNTDVSNTELLVYYENGDNPDSHDIYCTSGNLNVLSFTKVDGNMVSAHGEYIYFDGTDLMLNTIGVDVGEVWSVQVEKL